MTRNSANRMDEGAFLQMHTFHKKSIYVYTLVLFTDIRIHYLEAELVDDYNKYSIDWWAIINMTRIDPTLGLKT